MPQTLPEIQAEITALRRRIAELECAKQRLEPPTPPTTEGRPRTVLSLVNSDELTATLSAFVRRVTGVLRAEKCVILLYDDAGRALVAQQPALGFTAEELADYRVSIDQGIAGDVFRESRAIICHACEEDPRCQEEALGRFAVKDSLSVPMVMEHRNAQQQVVERATIGVVHVFNKRYGAKFTEEDVQLLSVFARNATAILSSARPLLQLADEKRRLEFTLESMTSGLLVIATDGHIQLINAAAQASLRLASRAVIGQPFTAVVDDAALRDFLAQALAQGGDLAHEITMGERICQLQTAAVRDHRGQVTGLMCVMHDVTDLRNLERLKSDFVSTVSHELRTPLTAIKGFIRTLLDDPAGAYFDQDTRMEFYGIIDAECDRLTRLISDLLNVSRIERGQPLHLQYGEVDVPACVARAVHLQRSYADRHTLEVELPDALPPVIADRDKLDQILTNLLGNAVKYSPEGGVITTRVRREGEALLFAVSDQGIGIPHDQLEKIFDRFHRVYSGDSQRVGGTGIGLFLVKSLVEAHHGAIWVESTLGKGSTFYFTLPLSPPGAEAAPRASS
ncbi:MAG TPA: ATP-binding protein [Armatimonadota bacterium]|nr:ATP-binding protein [Armatimonadota bacterium]